MLARGLAASGDDLAARALYDWLRAVAASPARHHDTRDESLRQVRAWLEQRPDLQKAVILAGLERCAGSDRFLEDSAAVWDALHGSELPSDFASWCLEQAVALAPARPSAAEELLDVSFRGHPRWVTDRGPHFDQLAERVRGYAVLEKRLAELRQGAARQAGEKALWASRLSEAKESGGARLREGGRGTAYVRSQAEALSREPCPARTAPLSPPVSISSMGRTEEEPGSRGASPGSPWW